MRKTILALGCSAAALGFAPAANAATPIQFFLEGSTGTFRAIPVSCDAGPAGCSGAFTATGTFSAPAGFANVAATFSRATLNGIDAIDFTSATLNGTSFDITAVNGIFTFGSVGPLALQETNTLSFSGFTGGNASFAGDLTFAAIPEPSTWALLLLGFGSIGMMIRRRRSIQVRTSVSFA